MIKGRRLLMICAMVACSAIALSACGGGGGGGASFVPAAVASAPAPVEQAPPPAAAEKPVATSGYEAPAIAPLAFIGDSLLAGFSRPGITAQPIDRIVAQSGGRIVAENLALGGTAAQQFLDGIAPLTGTTFEQWIASTPSQGLVIRYGGIEALFDPSHHLMADFKCNIERMVALAHQHGKAVALVGKINIPVNATANADFQVRYTETDRILRQVAAEKGVHYIEVSDILPAAGEMDDDLHPGLAYQTRVSDRIASRLVALIWGQ